MSVQFRSFQPQQVELTGCSLHARPIEVPPAPQNDVLLDIKQKLLAQTWPQALDKCKTQIVNQINLFTDPAQEGGTPQNDLPSLQSYVHLYVTDLFNSWIYQNPGVTAERVNTFFQILQFDKSFIPPLNFPSKDELPPVTPGMIPFLLKIRSIDAIVVEANSTAQRYEEASLPHVNGIPYVNIPYNSNSGRLYISNGKKDQPYHTWPFFEFTVIASGTFYANFTAVDAIKLPLTLQRVGDNERKNIKDRDLSKFSGVVGINKPFSVVDLAMRGFYAENDTTPGQRWLATMTNPDGSIKSGKYMTDPVITNALADYLKLVVNFYNENNPMYFTGDGNAGICSGYFKYEEDVLKFVSKNPQDTRTFPQKMPDLTNINAWISGGEGDWNISPIVIDPSGKDLTDWNQRNANWGVAKGLTGIINTGLSYDRIGTAANPMGGGNWTSPANLANRGKKSKKGEIPFANLYATAAQKASNILTNAYVCDYGDDLGAAGEIVGGPGDTLIVTPSYEM